jgi:hypothetical protein
MGLTYEILGIRPLLIDKLSGILNLKDEAPLILLQEGCNHCGILQGICQS